MINFYYYIEDGNSPGSRHEIGIVGVDELKNILLGELGEILDRYRERKLFKMEFVYCTKLYQIIKLDQKKI